MALWIGELYWLWIAIQIGSSRMFVIGILFPALIVCGPVGLYSLITPETPLLIDHSGLSGHRRADRKHRKRKL